MSLYRGYSLELWKRWAAPPAILSFYERAACVYHDGLTMIYVTDSSDFVAIFRAATGG